MSVAFRREEDEEHKEPRFELPLPPGPNLVTQRGLALIDAQVIAITAGLATATDDTSRDELKRSLRYWHTRQSTAIVAPTPGDEIAFGSRVTFRLNGRTRTIELVGSDEADPATDRIPFTAPLAAAMIGAGKGDLLDFAGRADAIEIVAVEAIGGTGEA